MEDVGEKIRQATKQFFKTKQNDFERIKELVPLDKHIDTTGFTKYPGALQGTSPLHGTGKGNSNLRINTIENKYRCFSCDTWGDIFDYVIKEEKKATTNLEALEYLAEKYGISLNKKMTPEEHKAYEEKKDKREKAQEALAFVVEQSHEQIGEWRAKIKKQRGFTDTTINKTKIGFFSQAVYQQAIQKYGKETLDNAGFFPMMAGRIIFPYFRFDKPVYAIFRAVTKESEAKGKYYKLKVSNSMENVLWTWESENKEERHRLLIAEGITDALSLAQAGFNVASAVTIQFKDNDTELIYKTAKNFEEVYLLNDGDERGIKGAVKTLKHLWKCELREAQICVLPKDKDINELLAKQKPEKQMETIEKLLETGKTLDDHYLATLNMNKAKDRKEIYALLEGLELDEQEFLAHKISLQAKGISKAAILKTAQKQQNTEKITKSIEVSTNTPSTSSTSSTFSTSVKLQNWGAVNLKEGLLIEQINPEAYLVNYKGKKQIVDVGVFKFKDGANYFLEFDDVKLDFSKEPQVPIYKTPSYKSCEAFVNGSYKTLEFEDIFIKIKKHLVILFEFRCQEDLIMTALAIAISWIMECMNVSFFLGIDATRGAGKTTLLEIIAILMRHGFMSGNTSTASIPRLKEMYDLNLALDEIDQIGKEKQPEIERMMRQAQRRGNKYIRLNLQSMQPEIFDPFGFYCYSFRATVEDAFMQRSIPIHTATCKVKQLPILNIFKDEILTPLHTDLFFWYFENLLKVAKKVDVVDGVEGVDGVSESRGVKLRENLYEKIMLDFNFNEEEKKLFANLVGRNIELGFVALLGCKLLGINITKELKSILETKQEDEDVPDMYYYEALQSLLAKKVQELKENGEWLLGRGNNPGTFYYPKNAMYSEFVRHLKEAGVSTIGTKRYNGLLKDLGFIEGLNLVSQKHFFEKAPLKCLLFEKTILKKLNLEVQDYIMEKAQSCAVCGSIPLNGLSLYKDRWLCSGCLANEKEGGLCH